MTQQVCQNFINENLINIKYFNKKNGGKYTAWAFGLRRFSGKYVVCADSDDLKTSDMLEFYDYHWRLLEDSQDYEKFWEIKTRCTDEKGNLVGTDHGIKVFDSDNNEYYYKYKFKGELSACRKVSVLLKHADFPQDFIFSNKCSHFSDGIIWSRISRNFKTRFFNKVTRIYNTKSPDSVSVGEEKSHLYNALINYVYLLSERRDILLKYDKTRFLKILLLLSSLSWRLKANVFVFKHLLCKIDFYIIFLILTLIKVIRGPIRIIKK